ncbi:uncharacterized protein LOC111322856 [Paramuricea clavata]|uniref:Uncharacterized protein LOC111322856 n=1 Tax=Paramuricea clavata TaxID=317549 RepID=A0A7D9E1A9_PARCT|nr:uncharacterized protein LOC111322856 [Paramuricea clavata]
MAGAPNEVDKVDVNKLFDHLSIDKKSKLKWGSGRQELESFVKTALSPLVGKWSSDDSTHKFKSNGITITFYNVNVNERNTLLIQGNIGEELKNHLLNIANETGDTRLPLIDSLRDFLSKNLDGDENKCKGKCSEIYPIQNEHIKRVGILGSKGQFCAAFYHVHKWGHRKHFCLDEDSCIIAKRTKDHVMELAQEAEKFAEKVKNLDEELGTAFYEEAKQFAAKKLNISAREGKEFVDKTKKFAMKVPKSFDERAKKAVEKQNKAKKATKKQKKAKQLAEEVQQLVEKAEQVAEEAKELVKKAEKAWCFQAKTVVAVVKFEKDGKILYEARYTNCGEKQKHAEDFFQEDIKKGKLGEKVEANPNGTITLYLTLQPCNKSTSIEGTATTPKDKTCCETLENIFNDTLLPKKIKLYVKAANLCRLSLIPENDSDDETLRKNAVDGIEMLMGIGVKFRRVTREDWHYLLSLTNELHNREDLEVHEGRENLDTSVQSIFDQMHKTISS